ncbi:hypothetical protein LTR01_009202, partial [Friedmanniomyces endolithicus]
KPWVSDFGPSLENGYDAGIFPGVRDAVSAGDWEAAKQMVERAADRLGEAAANLIR